MARQTAYKKLIEFGCAVAVKNGSVMAKVILDNDKLDTEPVQITYVKDKTFLNAINDTLGTSFKLADFKGN